MEKTIIHLTSPEKWDASKASADFTADSLETEGFIHCSMPDQVADTANRHFRGQQKLILLCIYKHKLSAELKLENTSGGTKLYPHIYGPINSDAIFRTVEYKAGLDGAFRAPEWDEIL